MPKITWVITSEQLAPIPPIEDCDLSLPPARTAAAVLSIQPASNDQLVISGPPTDDYDLNLFLAAVRPTPIFKSPWFDEGPYTIVRVVAPGTFLYAESIRATLFAESLQPTILAESIRATLFAEGLT